MRNYKWFIVLGITLTLLCKTKADSFGDKYGIGIITVNGTFNNGGLINGGFITKYTFDLYDSIGDYLKPVKSYNFTGDSNEYWNKLLELNYLYISNCSWFVCMLCIERKENWYKVRIKDNQEFWIKNGAIITDINWYGKARIEDHYQFYNWEQVIAQTIWVDRIDKNTNPIRHKPNEKAKIIKFDAPECFTAIRVKKNWLKITPEDGEGCFGEGDARKDYQKVYFKYGWIKWRDDKDFLIRVKK